MINRGLKNQTEEQIESSDVEFLTEDELARVSGGDGGGGAGPGGGGPDTQCW